jgi:surface antigen
LRNDKSTNNRTFKTKYMLKLSEVMTAKMTRLFVSILTASGLIFTVAELATIQTAKAASFCECVGYVKRVIGIPDATSTAHAADWDNNVLPNYGYQRLSSPRVGAIVVVERKGGLDPNFGHIGFVVGIQNDGKIQIKGANQGGNGTDANCNNVNVMTVTPNGYFSYWAKGGSTSTTNTNSVQSVNFTGVTSSNRTNVRSAPGTGASIIGYINPNTRVSFDAWTYSTAVNDLWTGRPDRRWYRITGTQYWVASATINGNAPGSQP